MESVLAYWRRSLTKAHSAQSGSGSILPISDVTQCETFDVAVACAVEEGVRPRDQGHDYERDLNLN